MGSLDTIARSSVRAAMMRAVAIPNPSVVIGISALTVLAIIVIAFLIVRQLRRRLAIAESRSQLYQDAEEARRIAQESEQRFRSLISASAEIFWIADAQGQLIDSPMWRELTGQALEDVTGRGWLDALHPDDRGRVSLEWDHAVETGTLFETEYRIRGKDGRFCWYLARGAPVREPGGAVREWVGTCTDVDGEKRTEAAEHILLETSRALASSLDLATTLRAVTQLVVPRFGDYCVLFLRDPDGLYRQVASAHVDPDKAALLEQFGRRYRADPANPNSNLARVITTWMPLLTTAPSIEEARLIFRDDDALRIHSELAPLSYVIVPLVARGHLFGVLSVASSPSGRHQDMEDLARVELLGARAALAIDNARLFTEANEARDRALRAARLETELAQARLETLRAQLNPHFLFNALNSIAMLVRRQATPEALRGVVGLSELLRRVLGARGAVEVPLREELVVVEHYLGIEQLRFRDRLSVAISAGPDTLDALVPNFMLQPLVENAVRHAVAHGSGTTHIRLESRRMERALRISIHDDGPGFPEGWDPATSGGLGLANTRERLQRMYPGDHRFEVRNGAGGGALVAVEIPLREAGSRPD